MKTVKQLNQEAGMFAASVWLKSAEKALSNGLKPRPLSQYDRHMLSLCLIPEWFKVEAERHNPIWWCNDRNFPAIKSTALAYAQQQLCVLGKYPTVLKHFTR